jgi:hypothetical protein
MNLFQEVDFIGHSGDPLHWKIECDALTDAEWKCLARMIMEIETRPFQSAIGIPRGGLKLSQHLNHYGTGSISDPYLICDDVSTTGGSLETYRDDHFNGKPCIGWVVFSRNNPPLWVNSLFAMNTQIIS